jgi:hypothetical protein
MKRRTFFKSVGTALAGLAIQPASAKPVPEIPVPPVRSRRAYVTTISGYEKTLVRHSLNSGLVCGLAGDAKGAVRMVRIDPVDQNQVQVSLEPPPRLFRWFKRGTPVHKLVLYVPL